MNTKPKNAMDLSKRKNNQDHDFDISSCLNAKGRLKVVLIHKHLRFDAWVKKARLSLGELLSRNDSGLTQIREADRLHMISFEKVKKNFEEIGADIQEIRREELPRRNLDAKLVVTVGGDGTLLDASHYVGESPILGINSNPARSVGSLCVTDADGLAELLQRVLSGALKPTLVTRISASVDDEPLPCFALNEFLFAHENPAATSQYMLEINGKMEFQKSSGIWIGAAAGSTGAIASAGGEVQAIDDDRLQMVVREPYVALSEAPTILHAFASGEQIVRITCNMPKGHLYCDGPQKSFGCKVGSRIALSNNGPKLKLFVTKEMEEKRQNIGLARSKLENREEASC